MKRPVQDAPRSTAEQRLKPAIFVPERPPDDPGVAQTETEEQPELSRALARGANPLKRRPAAPSRPILHRSGNGLKSRGAGFYQPPL